MLERVAVTLAWTALMGPDVDEALAHVALSAAHMSRLMSMDGDWGDGVPILLVHIGLLGGGID